VWPRRFGKVQTWPGTSSGQWSIAKPWISIWTPTLTRIVIRANLSSRTQFSMLRDTLQNLRWDLSVSLWINSWSLYQVNLITGFVLFSRFCVLASLWSCHAVSGQMMMDTIIPRGPEEYLSIIEGANTSLELSCPLTYFSDAPKICRYNHPVMGNVWQTPKYTVRNEGTQYSQGLRKWVYVNILHDYTYNFLMMLSRSISLCWVYPTPLFCQQCVLIIAGILVTLPCPWSGK
jgi:hypothetical protein